MTAVSTAILMARANGQASQQREPRIHERLEALGPDVTMYDSHVTTLANPFLEGRLPGTRGMEIAKEYVEYWLRRAGTEPAFEDEGRPSWRQPFLLGQKRTVIQAARLGAGDLDLESGKDFVLTGLGAATDVELEGELVFCGYGIEDGKDGYTSFDDATDLQGKVALVLRFEPMDQNGRSKWQERAWSPAAGLQQKLTACAKRSAKAILFVNTQGADDPRVSELFEPGGGGERATSVPVFHVSAGGAERLVHAASGGKASLDPLAAKANAGTAMAALGRVRLEADLVRERLEGENVGGVVRGRGVLSDQWVVVGAHLDHLGYGNFGSRRGAGQLHPGADDNASGVAGILMIADKYRRHIAELDASVPLRNVLFLAFSGEESGLVGSRHYVTDPIAPLPKHALMINFDMIGRMKNERLAVYGAESAKGMEQWLDPLLANCGLEIVKNPLAFGGSDHLAFVQRQVPYLFSIIADFHNDYHTPDDVAAKIDREAAIKAVLLYTEIVKAAAARPERFEWQARKPRATRSTGKASGEETKAQEPPADAAEAEANPPRRMALKVRFGIKPGDYSEESSGVLVAGVTADTPAAKGGVLEGDVIESWNGAKVGDVVDWMRKLMQHNPGDKVKVGVRRAGKPVVLTVELEAPDSGR
ncbi:MAG TPA: M28 family peptidase [Planctomycetota bacterium]|nr:M28 family peptidase [Planctomycetota bacterium]